MPDRLDYLIALEAIDVPTWAYVGAGDWMCRPTDAAAISGRIRRSRPLRIVGRRHGDPMDPDHFQLFTRREMTRLWDEVVAEALPIAADER
jgi:pimeloyl-ACP methyl ester carboxylesterase